LPFTLVSVNKIRKMLLQRTQSAMINQIYLSVLFRAKSVKENIYKSLLTLSTWANTHHTQHIRNDHKIQTKQLPAAKNNNNKKQDKNKTQSKLNVLKRSQKQTSSASTTTTATTVAVGEK